MVSAPQSVRPRPHPRGAVPTLPGHVLALAVAALAALFCADHAHADRAPELRGEGGVARIGSLSTDDESDGTNASIEFAIIGDMDLRLRYRLYPRHRIMLRTGLVADLYPDVDGRNTTNWKSLITHTYLLETVGRREWRNEAGYEFRRRDGSKLEDRIRLQTEFRQKVRINHRLYARLRGTYIQRVDSRTSGFDQGQARLELGYLWESPETDSLVRTNVAFEVANADESRFDFQSVSMGTEGELALNRSVNLIARTRGRLRDFNGPFSMTDPTERSERFISVAAGASGAVTKDIDLIGLVGWEAQDSNVLLRDYSGLTLLFGTRFAFDLD